MSLLDRLKQSLNSNTSEDSVETSTESTDDDTDFWPYYYDEEFTESIYNYETKSAGYPLDDDIRQEIEFYAGEWPRNVMDSRSTRPKDNTWLGFVDDPVKGVEPVGVAHNSLWQHMAFFGQTGYGKSTVLQNIMYQWMHAGYGVCFIDRKGQDVKEMVQKIPKDRLDDLVWVEPASKDFDKTVGFNFFETYREPGETGFEYEVDKIVSEFVEVLDVDEGARMQSITESLTRQLVKAEEAYTPVEFHFILSDEEERQVFAEEFGDQLEKPFLEQIAATDQKDLSALQRRVKNITENKALLNVVGHRESSINIGEAIKKGKILLVKLSNIGDEDIQKFIATIIIRRIWAAIQERSNLQRHQYDPYFLVIDEFAKIEDDSMGIDEILSEARSLQLSVTLATQQLRQLSETSKQGVENNCKSLFTFRVGSANQEDANHLAKSFSGVQSSTLLDIDEYVLIGKVFMRSGDSKVVAIDTFPPYPPLRSPEKAEALIRESMHQYGTDPIDVDETDWDEYRISNRLEESGKREPEDEEDKGVVVNDAGDKITPRQVLDSVHTAKIQGKTVESDDKEWVTYDETISELERKYITYGESIENDTTIDNVLEKISGSLLNRDVINGNVCFRLTPDGEKEAYITQDSGTGGNAGKILHRLILRKGIEAFAKRGYITKIPKQIGEEQPDGVATPPINPRKESTDIKEAKEMMNKLESQNPKLTQLFDDNEVAIESETNTPDKPKQTLKNVAKAMNKGQKCALVAPDGLTKKLSKNDDLTLEDLSEKEIKDCFNSMANKIEKIISSPPCVNKITDEGHRRFYNAGTMRLSNGATPVIKRPKDGSSVRLRWYEIDGSQIIVKSANNEKPIAKFNNAGELKEPEAYKFDYHAYRDKNKGKTVVVDNNENVVGEYQNKSALTDEWQEIKKPLIPEHIFPGGEIPDRDKWEIIIIPDSSRNIEPQIYRKGTYIPLHSGDLDNPILIDDLLSDTAPDPSESEIIEQKETIEENEEDDTEAIEENDTNLDAETDKPEVSDSSDSKSNTEHIKDSDEVWTKPEQGDDDYNPAKDGNNFRGTDEEYHHETGDGGMAREEEKENGMDDYVMPNMKKRKKEKEELEGITIKDESSESSTKDESEETETEEDEESEYVPNRNRSSIVFDEITADD